MFYVQEKAMKRSIIVGMAAMLVVLGVESTRAHGAAVNASSFVGGTYVQDFDTLDGGIPASANAVDSFSGTPAWSDGVTLAGWHAWVASPAGVSLTSGVPSFYVNSDGNNTQAGRLLDLGTNQDSDRALGMSKPNNSNQYIGVQLANDTGSALTSFTVTYDAEQWRLIGHATLTIVPEEIEVQYRIFDAGLGSVNAANFGDWTVMPTLDYTSETTVTPGSTTALDGNDAANRVADLTATVEGVDWQSGQELWIRWVDLANAGTSFHQVGIDNVRISAAGATVPEPSSVALLVLGSVGLGLSRRRSKNVKANKA